MKSIKLFNVVLIITFFSLSLLLGFSTFYFINNWDALHHKIFGILHWSVLFFFVLSCFEKFKYRVSGFLLVVLIPALIFVGVDLLDQIFFEGQKETQRPYITVSSIAMWIVLSIIFITALKAFKLKSNLVLILLSALSLSSLLLFFVISGYVFFP